MAAPVTGAGGEPLEIERKYLIRRPAESLLDRLCTRRIEIEQIYLCAAPEQGSRRVRHSREAGTDRYFYNEKIPLTDLTRIEREREIGAGEYEALLAEAERGRIPIRKTRWCVPWAGHTLEIDLFPFWERQAFCEVELPSESVEPSLPDWLTVLREVSGDPRFTNHALALQIPPEEA